MSATSTLLLQYYLWNQQILNFLPWEKSIIEKRILPWSTTIVLFILIAAIVWFLKGGTFKFYTSLFFGLYFLTKQAWLSIILVGVAQTIIFLPLRIIGTRFHSDLKLFEDELEKSKSDYQYFLFKKKVSEGNSSILFYMLNFVLLALAFISVGRVFFLDFYSHPVDPKYLYDFIPYPQYPINGIIFHFPFIRITQTFALDWSTIFFFWAYVLVFFLILRFLWVLLRKFLTHNKEILKIRISYNRFLIFVSSFIGTVFIISLFVLRHIPTSAQFYFLSADLAKQNTGFNIITAVCTLFATLYAGFNHNWEIAKEAKKKGIPNAIIKKVFKTQMYTSLRNGIFLSAFALWITRLMPCSHDLSVLSFEALYFLSPITFDLLIPKHKHV